MNRVFIDDNLQQQFERDGIVSIQLLSVEEIEVLKKSYAEIENDFSDLNFHSTMFSTNPAYRQRVSAVISNAISNKLKAILYNYKILFANYIVKEPNPNTAVGIHQDWSLTDESKFTSVNVWCPLIDINKQNGVFFGLKGSHITFNNVRYTPYEDNAYEGLVDYITSNSEGYELKAGQAVIYHGGLVHYSHPNNSTERRIAIGSALIPEGAVNLHYYKPQESEKLEVYAVNEEFYNGFDFFKAPQGVTVIDTISQYRDLDKVKALILKEIAGNA
jgi:ectoine hydroxylase-related dioxygenase (phytanoyl-CoA dioxygenase family)